MFQNDPLMCLTGEVRCSYVCVDKPRVNTSSDGTPQGDPRYSVTLLIPKTDVATYNELRAAMMAAYEEGVAKSWQGLRPQLRDIIHDGDGVRESGMPYGPECKGHWVVTAASKRKPDVKRIVTVTTAGGTTQRLMDVPKEEIYSGMYARCTVRFFTYNLPTRKGVGCGLNNILKTREGDPLSGGTTGEQDFSGLLQTPGAAAPMAAPAPAPVQAPSAAEFNPFTAPGVQPMTVVESEELPW